MLGQNVNQKDTENEEISFLKNFIAENKSKINYSIYLLSVLNLSTPEKNRDRIIEKFSKIIAINLIDDKHKQLILANAIKNVILHAGLMETYIKLNLVNFITVYGRENHIRGRFNERENTLDEIL